MSAVVGSMTHGVIKTKWSVSNTSLYKNRLFGSIKSRNQVLMKAICIRVSNHIHKDNFCIYPYFMKPSVDHVPIPGTEVQLRVLKKSSLGLKCFHTADNTGGYHACQGVCSRYALSGQENETITKTVSKKTMPLPKGFRTKGAPSFPKLRQCPGCLLPESEWHNYGFGEDPCPGVTLMKQASELKAASERVQKEHIIDYRATASHMGETFGRLQERARRLSCQEDGLYGEGKKEFEKVLNF